MTAVVVAAAPITGCDGAGNPIILPFGQVTAVQLFDETNYTVALSVEEAVVDPSSIARVNWVYGDGGGFEEGPSNRATMTHRYTAPGTYTVIAYIFGSEGLIGQITTDIEVVENDDGENPTPNPGPEDFPGAVSSPIPADDAEEVAFDVELRWTPGILNDSFDVYFGTNQAAVESATRSDDAFQGNQTDSRFSPEALAEDTDYYWRVDSVNEASTTKGDVYHFTSASAPEKSRVPSPASGSTSARVDVELAWQSGDRAKSHDVYFGKDKAAVTAATTDTDDIFLGNQADTTFDPTDDDAEIEGQLLADTEYFWRVDEVGDGGTTKGDVWSFKTSPAPSKITSPTPADAATGVNVEQVLSWLASPDVEQFDVYLGTDPVDVEEAKRGTALHLDTLSVTSFDPVDLVGSKTYYWRVDTIGRGGTTKGDVLRFTTIAPPGAVAGPFAPLDDATNQNTNPMLQWNVGGGGPTTLFMVYLSPVEASVINMDAGALIATQDVSFNTFKVEEASSLDSNTHYFWRVVSQGPGGKTAGQVLEFTTGTAPQIVSGPNPAINAKGVPLDKTLSWSAATGAATYDIYFGTDQADVDNASSDDAAFLANVPGTSHNPGELIGNTQYFWRVDSRSAGGTTKGIVWRFTTAPAKASVPIPFDGEDQVDIEIELAWIAGDGATSHDVYLGTDQAAVTNATRSTPMIFRGNKSNTTYKPNPELDGAITYYWRIDEVNADGTSKGDVWSFTTIAGLASNPVPTDGANGVPLTPSLDWDSDPAADAHDVYFGTSSTAVASATTASTEYQGTFPVGTAPPFQPPNTLQGLTFYFWRVDTVTADGTTKGEVWKFRTGPGRATAPSPADFAIDIAADTNLTWTTGAGAVTQELYIGTNNIDVANSDINTLQGTTIRINVTSPPVNPGALLSNTTYYWRVDSVAANGTTRTKGDLWEFTTRDIPAQVGSPTPFNGATAILLNVTLNWGAAPRAQTYDVYFGTSQADVGAATNASPEFQGNQSVTNYQPTALLANTTYYWRIDALNEAGVRTGVVWSFTTAP